MVAGKSIQSAWMLYLKNIQKFMYQHFFNQIIFPYFFIFTDATLNSLTFVLTPNSKRLSCNFLCQLQAPPAGDKTVQQITCRKHCTHTEHVTAFMTRVHLIISFWGTLFTIFLLLNTNGKHEQRDGEHSDSSHALSSHLLTCIVSLQLGQRVDGDFAQRAVQQLLRLLLLRLRRREGSVVGGGLGRGGGRSRMRRRQSRGQGGGDRGRGRW